MATFFLHNSVIGLSVEPHVVPVPQDATVLHEFDEEVNASVVDLFLLDYNGHSVVDGQLCYKGQPIQLLPESAKKSSRKDFQSTVDAYIVKLNEYLAIADGATTADIRSQIKLLTQGMKRLALLLKE